VPEIYSSVEAVRAVRFYMSLKHAGNHIGMNCPVEVTSNPLPVPARPSKAWRPV